MLAYRYNRPELINNNLVSDDYIGIAKESDLIFLENLPNFNEDNSNLSYYKKVIFPTKDEMLNSQEVFLSSASSFVTPIIEIDNIKIGNGIIGKTSIELRNLYFKNFN